MLECIKQMLLDEYGIHVICLESRPAGWSASAWKVQAAGGDYFLKVFDKNKPSTKGWVQRIDIYMPVVLWLNAQTNLHGRMTAPLLNKKGMYKIEDADFLYMIFPFIHGQTIGGDKLKACQVDEIAQTVAILHTYGDEIPVSTLSLRETFDVSFCNDLSDWLKAACQYPEPLLNVLLPYGDTLAKALEALKKGAQNLRSNRGCFALCHTDIHGWNLMQGESLILIDWEGLRLAPVEADLFSFTDTFFFADAWEDFMAVYRSVHKEYEVNEDALRFYRLRRRLEDIHAFAQSILMDTLAKADQNRAIFFLERECGLLHGMY